jgi:hypothetical protein
LLTFDIEIVKANAPISEISEEAPNAKNEIAEVKTDTR